MRAAQVGARVKRERETDSMRGARRTRQRGWPVARQPKGQTGQEPIRVRTGLMAASAGTSHRASEHAQRTRFDEQWPVAHNPASVHQIGVDEARPAPLPKRKRGDIRRCSVAPYPQRRRKRGLWENVSPFHVKRPPLLKGKHARRTWSYGASLHLTTRRLFVTSRAGRVPGTCSSISRATSSATSSSMRRCVRMDPGIGDHPGGKVVEHSVFHWRSRR